MIASNSSTPTRAGAGACAAALALSLLACGPPKTDRAAATPSDPSRPEGHRRMVALLRDVAERAARENAYLSDENVRELRERVDGLPAGTEVEERFGLLLELGREELRLGNNEAAIERLGQAYALMPDYPERGRREAASAAACYLGVAWLRLGESQNCIARHTSDSCIFPIRDAGVHVNQEGARKAIEYFQETIRVAGNSWESIAAAWLLNIAYMTVGEWPDGVPEAYLIRPEVFASPEDFPRFVDIAPRLGINAFDLSGGAIAEDFNGDGLLDLVTSTSDSLGPMHYFERASDGRFVDRSEESGLSELLGGLNLLQADYDNDGDTDILVLRGAWLGAAGRQPNSLLQNDGNGRFTDVTFDAGLGEQHYPTQTASWGDYDNDGDLDLYVGNEANRGEPYPNQLFRNNGDGTFTDVAAEAGVEDLRYTKAVIWGDYDGDRLPDLYVSDLRSPNRLFRNNGDGTFTDVAESLGVTQPIDSFPTWFWDVNNDGALDLFVASYYQAPPLTRVFAVAASYLGLPQQLAETHRIYLGDGRGGFRDATVEMGLTLISLPMGANFGDLDLDGWLDFYLGTGYPSFAGLMPNVMYHNRGGRRFVDVTTPGGFGHLQKGHGIAFADFDQDGDQDVFEQMGGALRADGFGNVLYENPGFGNRWVAVRLIGVQSNRSAIGARVRVDVVDNGKRRSVYKHVNSGGSFGCNPLTQQIGLGRATRIARLEVFWPTSDRTQVFDDVPLDSAFEIVEDRDELRPRPWDPIPFR